MDFKLVLEKLLMGFKKENVRYALIGGLALGAWGVTRSTVDIDFLVLFEDMDKVDRIMNKLGYSVRYKSENVSQYISPLKIFGEIDFLHAFRKIAVSMLQRAEERKMFNETIPVKVLKIEDLIGLKVQAIANNESRKNMDLSDIESLIKENKADINWDTLEEYFDLFDFKALFNELRRKINADNKQK
ncbi:MAG: nucleotidyl transferase AbiEii/AbiGii toxin family protein [bacterium]